jgi:hypothetical protein
MRTKADAEAKLAQLPLTRAVAVADTVAAKTGKSRRSYTFSLPTGNQCTVEIDAEPSEQQLADLVRHLPLPDERRTEALEIVTGRASVVAPR